MLDFRYIGVCLAVAAVLCSCSPSPQAREANYLRQGKAQLAKRDFNRAMLDFRNAAQAMPRDAEAYYQLGLAYMGSAAYSNAAEAFRRATEISPKHIEARLKLAEMMAASRNADVIKQAADLLHSVLAAAPDNSEAIHSMAIAEWLVGRQGDAEKRLEEALQKVPTDLQSAVTLARIKVSARDLTGAEQVLVRANQSVPRAAPVAVALAELYLVAKQPEKAEREFRRALQWDPKNAAALLRLASLQVTSRRTDEAEVTFRQIAALPGERFRSAHATFLYGIGMRKAAIAELEDLIQSDPDDRITRSRLVDAYVATNQLQRAEQILRAALKKNSKDADALFQLSELSLKSGKVDEASRDLKQIIRSMPDSAPAHAVLAAVYRAQHLPHTEQQELNDALRIAPELLQARLRLASSFLEENAGGPALEVLDQAPAEQKRVLAWFVERGWALLAVGRTSELRSTLDQVLRVSRPRELLLQDAIVGMQEHDYARARADSEEVLRKNPEEIRAVRTLVNSYMAQKQPEKAAKRLLELTTAHPRSAVLQQIQGEWYLNSGRLTEARKAFEAANAADFKYIPAALSLADLDRREKHIDAARQRLNTIIAANGKNLDALLLSASLESDAGNSEAAIARYRAVLAVESSNLIALNNLAYVLASQNPDEALSLALQAAQIAPESAEVADTLGRVYYCKGIFGAAVEYLQAAVSKEPTPRRQFHLAKTYLKAGDRDRGLKMLEAALQADPALPRREPGW